MKTIKKITVLIVIAVLAAASCAPDLEPHFDNSWQKDLEASKSVEKNTDLTNTGTAVTSGGKRPAITSRTLQTAIAGTRDSKGDITIQFSPDADVLKGITTGEQLVAKMKESISFFTYEKTTTVLPVYTDSITAGWTTTNVDYKFVSRNGDIVNIELDKVFGESDSHVIFKIDSTKYTFGNGQKMDIDNNGIGGEIHYDDYYETLNVDGIRTSDTSVPPKSYQSFVSPGNRNWSITLSALPDNIWATHNNTDYPTYSNANRGLRENKDVSTARNFYLATHTDLTSLLSDTYSDATFTTGSYAGNTEAANENRARVLAQQAAYEEVVKIFAPYFKIERFENGNWVTHTGGTFNDTRPLGLNDGNAPSAPSVDYNNYVKSLGFKRIIATPTFTNGTAYRVVCEIDDLNKLQTEKEYYGVKQRIKIISGSDEITMRNSRKKLVTAPVYYYNTDSVLAPVIQAASFSSSELIFHDSNMGNLIFKIEFNSQITVPPVAPATITDYYYLKDYTNDMTTFMDNFKIFVTSAANTTNIVTATDVKEIAISDIKFSASESFPEDTATQKYHGIDTLEITLDPDYKFDGSSKIFFYIGPGIVYANSNAPGGKPTLLGGSPWVRDGWFFYGPIN